MKFQCVDMIKISRVPTKTSRFDKNFKNTPQDWKSSVMTSKMGFDISEGCSLSGSMLKCSRTIRIVEKNAFKVFCRFLASRIFSEKGAKILRRIFNGFTRVLENSSTPIDRASFRDTKSQFLWSQVFFSEQKKVWRIFQYFYQKVMFRKNKSSCSANHEKFNSFPSVWSKNIRICIPQPKVAASQSWRHFWISWKNNRKRFMAKRSW